MARTKQVKVKIAVPFLTRNVRVKVKADVVKAACIGGGLAMALAVGSRLRKNKKKKKK